MTEGRENHRVHAHMRQSPEHDGALARVSPCMCRTDHRKTGRDPEAPVVEAAERELGEAIHPVHGEHGGLLETVETLEWGQPHPAPTFERGGRDVTRMQPLHQSLSPDYEQ